MNNVDVLEMINLVCNFAEDALPHCLDDVDDVVQAINSLRQLEIPSKQIETWENVW